MIASFPDEPAVLLLVGRALAHDAQAREALELLQTHRQLRGQLAPAALAQLLGEIGAATPELAVECRMVLAREQLRRRDFEAARHTLEPLRTDGLEPALLARARVLRAEALLRCGEPAAAALELQQAKSGDTGVARWQIELGLADVAVLAGEIGAARAALRALGGAAREQPRVAARRGMTLALANLLEGRPHRALAWARRARLAYRRCKDPTVDPLVLKVEVAALVALDRIDRASAVTAQAAPETGGSLAAAPDGSLAPVLAGALLYRRGAFTEVLRSQKQVYAALDKRSDRVLLAFAAHFYARCAMGSGALEAAEEHLRIASGIAGDPGFAVLRPMCELDFALLCELRGERGMAKESLTRALSGALRSPLARIERWALSLEPGPVPRAGFEAGEAYGALRAAERALEVGALAEADAAAARAEGWYRRVGAVFDTARAQLARAEALARSGRTAEARPLLDACLAAAERNGHSTIATAARLVAASIADRAGELAAYRSAIAAALERAAPDLVDGALLAAAMRAGVPVAQAQGTAAPWRSRVERLGLARPGAVAYEREGRRWLLAPGELPADEADLLVALDAGEATSAALRLKLPEQRLRLLAALARAGKDGITLEALYATVWGGRQYHPLRHRNTIYVALNRLRESLAKLLPDVESLQVLDGSSRLAPGLRVAVQEDLRKTK
jgi:hypothetical protein